MPLLWISLSFIAGIMLASILSLPTWAWILISIAFFLFFLFLRFLSPRLLATDEHSPSPLPQQSPLFTFYFH